MAEWYEDIFNTTGDIIGSNAFQNATGLLSAGYDIYSGVQNQNRADRMYDLMYGTASKQDEYADTILKRQKDLYWPLEDKQYARATADFDATSGLHDAQRSYTINRGHQDIARAMQHNEILDPAETRMLQTLTENPDALRDRLSSEATAGVSQSFGRQAQVDARRMSLAGVNPNSGAASDYVRSTGNAEALAQANARNNAARVAEDTALSRNAQALNYRAGIPFQSQNVTPSINAGNIQSALANNANLGLTAANSFNTQAQQNYTGAATALNSMAYRPYMQNYLKKISS